MTDLALSLPLSSSAPPPEVKYIRHIVMPGGHFVSWEPAEIVTLLGSCVAACIWDKKRKIGGMNHFMLPDCPLDEAHGSGFSLRYGLYAMERLINDLLMMGCRRENLIVKVFGGGNITGAGGERHVGRRNCEFVIEFLRKDGLHLAGVDLGGTHSRRIRFYTDTGKVRVYKVEQADKRAIELENQYHLKVKKTPEEGSIEFF